MKFLLVFLVFGTLVGCAGHRYKSGDRFHNMWTQMDANKDGEVTKAEFDSAHEKHFKDMDTNSDGKVTKEEKKAYMKSKKACYKKKACGKKKDCDKKRDCKMKDCKKKDCKGGGCKVE